MPFYFWYRARAYWPMGSADTGRFYSPVAVSDCQQSSGNKIQMDFFSHRSFFDWHSPCLPSFMLLVMAHDSFPYQRSHSIWLFIISKFDEFSVASIRIRFYENGNEKMIAGS